MKRLIIMRHGQAASVFGYEDKKRPLTKQGTFDVRSIATQLSEAGVEIDLAIVSSALRTKQSIESFVEEDRYQELPIKYSDSLYLAGFDELLSTIAEYADTVETVLWLGHNPGVSEVATSLSQSFHAFQPADVLIIENELNDWVESLCGQTWKKIRSFSPIS